MTHKHLHATTTDSLAWKCLDRVDTVQYNVDLGCRSDKHLGTVLKDEGVSSLDELLEKKNKK